MTLNKWLQAIMVGLASMGATLGILLLIVLIAGKAWADTPVEVVPHTPGLTTYKELTPTEKSHIRMYMNMAFGSDPSESVLQTLQSSVEQIRAKGDDASADLIQEYIDFHRRTDALAQDMVREQLRQERLELGKKVPQ